MGRAPVKCHTSPINSTVKTSCSSTPDTAFAYNKSSHKNRIYRIIRNVMEFGAFWMNKSKVELLA